MTGVLLKSKCCPEACCLPDGTCADLSRADCIARGGTPQGCGTQCADTDIDCEGLQACCSDNGDCQDFTPADCIAAGGTPQGKGTTCLDELCGPCGDCTIPPCSLNYLVSAPALELENCNGGADCFVPAHSAVVELGCGGPFQPFVGPVGLCNSRWNSVRVICFPSDPSEWRLSFSVLVNDQLGGAGFAKATAICPSGNYGFIGINLDCDIVGDPGPATVG